MASYRRDRIDEEVAKTLSEILRSVKDYRITGSFVSITKVSVAPDLSAARVFFSALGKNCDPKEIRKGLISASGYMRTRLAQIMNLRQTPKLEFVYDSSMESGAHIHSLLHQVEDELAAAEERDRRLESEQAAENPTSAGSDGEGKEGQDE